MARNDLHFKTDTQRQKGKTLRFLAGFLIVLILCGGASALAIWRAGGNKEEAETTQSPVETDVYGETYAPWAGEGKYQFLVYGADNDEEELYFLAVVQADLDEKCFRVLPLDSKQKAPFDGVTRSFAETFALEGASALVRSVEEFTKLPILRYCGAGEKGFRSSVNAMGSVPLQIDKPIHYSSDSITLSLGSGRQTLTGDLLLRYLRYCDTLGATGRDLQAQAVCALLDLSFVPKNLEISDKLFPKLINEMQCNVSAMDFRNVTPILQAIAGSGQWQGAKAVQDLQALTGENK